MLESVKISRRQSEIRQELAALVGKEKPSEDETRAMETLDSEYRQNETRYRAALIAEDTERREAKDVLETRGGNEWAELVGRFEMRQVALALDEGRALDGATAEVVSEMRSKGGYRGYPVPLEALEIRTGETVASGTPDPRRTAPIIDRLFPASVAGRMGAQMVNIDFGTNEYPVSLGAATVAWQATETGNVGGPSAYETAERALRPDFTVGAQMRVTRRALKQSGAGLEQAIRREMNASIGAEMDRVVFQGSGSSGEPTGILTTAAEASPVPFNVVAVDAAATWAAFRGAISTFVIDNAAGSASAVRLLLRPEVWNGLDGALFDEGSGVTEWDRVVKHIPAANIVLSSNALPSPDGSPAESTAVLTTSAGGTAPLLVAVWGGIDMIRDVFSDAQSGGLRMTALATLDLAHTRGEQIAVLTGIQ